ncbi:MAG: S41 family peptidase [Odoribacteraceae bacterium]|jgi:carboxyl-terminal processing protease|nr:S41 family peptidase [Odoribacteraceae bacterium]
MKSARWISILWLLSLAWGNAQAQRAIEEQTIKYNQLLRMVDQLYVDTVNVARLTETAIIKLLEELDPHSVYLSREEVLEANEPLEGGFFGIGIQFTIMGDTLMVADVLVGGPSEKVGLLPGDRIVTIDGESVVGIGLTNAGVRARLKGKEHTLVKVGVWRRQLIEFNIRRGMIPIHSVDASYMLSPTVGYVHVARFAATTTGEFDQAVKKLLNEGMEDLVIDLQENHGGYMGAAVELADHLLDARRLIVYTEGRDQRLNDSFYSTPAGLFQRGRVVILQDESSASASEILAGAVQDWDRGLIVGRRSFGKGLVQRPLPLQDGSVVRLTVAHYFTPSGRNIQKSYEGGALRYRAELFDRYSAGELFSPDSIRVTDTTRYFTREHHRLVHGGGGIVPDLFVPLDTTVDYRYLNMLMAKGVIHDHEFDYINRHRDVLRTRYPSFRRFADEFSVTPEMIREVVARGEGLGVKRDEKALAHLLPALKQILKALIARDLWGVDEYYRVVNETNSSLLVALEALRDGRYERLLQGNTVNDIKR